MTPEQIMRKRPFLVPIPPNVSAGAPPVIQKDNAVVAYTLGNIGFERKTQADFLKEFFVSSHKINSLKYYPNTLYMDPSNGKYQAKVRSRIAIGFQERIKTKRKTALIGNNVGMRILSAKSSSKQQDLLARYREGWEEKNIEIAIDKAIESVYVTADSAVYIYISEKKVGWRTFSYQDGDVLFPHFHPLTGEIELLGRLYEAEDWDGNKKRYLDVIDSTSFVTYKEKDDVSGWVMEGEPVSHGFPVCPVAYHRSKSNGPVWSASQGLIESYEIAISQFAENNAAYALRILYTLGGDMEVMTNTDGTPSRIDSVDPDAKVGFLEPAAGADGAFATQLAITEKNIMRGSFAVETPEIKSGADMSSRTVKMLFADSYLKALEDSQEYQMFLDRVAYLFRFAYMVETGISDFNDFKIKTYLEPFIFMSEADVINAIQQLVAAGVLSKKTATEIAYNTGYGTADEWDRIIRESQEELVRESAIQTATQQTQPTNNPVNASRNNA